MGSDWIASRLLGQRDYWI